MSELVSEIAHADEPIATSEFLGSTFNERRKALSQVEAFRKETRQALADSITVLIGRQVLMTFRPSFATSRDSLYSFPTYSLFDDERTPLEAIVTIQDVNPATLKAVVGKGEQVEGEFDHTYNVHLASILSISELEMDEEQ